MAEALFRNCRVTGAKFSVSPLEQELCRKLELPLPTLSPQERLRQISAASNYINLYHGKCALTGEKVIQVFRPGAPFPVYSNPAWWSDEWSAETYGRPYDFARPFFDQFQDLQRTVPQPALTVSYTTIENCEYINGSGFCKNCYLVMNANYTEDSSFCFGVQRCRDCMDCTSCYDSELCYECVRCLGCYELRHSVNCRSCRESAFLWNCIGCSNCFGCVNLRQASYCWFNEQLDKAAFGKRFAAIEWDNAQTIAGLDDEYVKFVKTHLQPALRGIQLENCTGDFIDNCRNAERCFNGRELEDCVNCLGVERAKDCLDMYFFGQKCELGARSCRIGHDVSNLKMCILCILGSSDMEYSVMCSSCKDCFGCIGLRHKQYCILNKQYGRSEYLELRRRIISQMRAHGEKDASCAYGEFFPFAMSLYPYNDSDAEIFFPLEKDAAALSGDDAADEQRSTALPVESMPPRSSLAPAELKSSFICRTTGKPFAVTKHELSVRKKRSYPLPREHWKARLLRREALKNRPALNEHACALTKKPLVSTFPPDAGWLICDTEEYGSLF